MHVIIDLTGHNLVNLGDPVHGQDAATMQYVSNYLNYLNNNKVNWSGGRMTGVLDMGDNKLTNLGDPENNKDAVNKEYVDNLFEHEHDFNPYAVGRYIVIPNNDDSNVYFSVKTKKNIDIGLNHLSLELKNRKDNPFDQDNIWKLQNVSITPGTYTLLPGLGKALGVIQYNIPPEIRYTDHLKPWTMLFSSRPTSQSGRSLISCRRANRTFMYIIIEWEPGVFKYVISNNEADNPNLTIRLATTKFTHVALECVDNKLTIWINGKSRKMHNVDLGGISYFKPDFGELGVLQIYDRDLSKF